MTNFESLHPSRIKSEHCTVTHDASSPEDVPPRVWLTDSDDDQCRIETIKRSRFEATWSGDGYETWGNELFTQWSGGVIE
jgi:hypothetical protein